MYKISLAVCFICLAINTNAQKCKKYYKDSLEPGSKLVKCTYCSTLEKTEDDKFIFKRYYPDTKAITQYATAQSKSMNKLHGLYKEFWDDGTLVQQGFYVDNMKQGEWLENENESGAYKDGRKQGLWIKKIKDSIIIKKTHYVNGIVHGKRIRYDSTGVETLSETFENGVLVNSIEDPEKTQEYMMPRFPGCEDQNLSDKERDLCSKEKMLMYIYSNLRYPTKAREKGVQGAAMMKFLVNKDGSISDIKALNGLCKEIEKTVIKIIESMPTWIPGQQNGQVVDVQYTLPVKFRLE